MSIFLIRHGETEGNAARIVQRPESPLSARGAVQAERLARRLAREGIAQIVSSDLARAVTTAARLHDVTGVPLAFDPLLQERNFGDVRGTPYADLGVDLFAPDYAPPNGETWPAFHARVDRAWARIQELATAARGHPAVAPESSDRRNALMAVRVADGPNACSRRLCRPSRLARPARTIWSTPTGDAPATTERREASRDRNLA